MSCITWNARGLGNQRAFRELKRLVVEKSQSLLFLCEMKMRDFKCSWWKEALGFTGLFVVNYEGRSGGLMLIWKDPATEADFGDVVYRGWDKNNQTVSLPNRLKDCKEHLKSWAGSRFGTIPRQLLKNRKQLSHLQTHGQWQKSISRIGVLAHEVEELATKEELYWKQRSRVNWLSHGDRNSKYFHACATARRTRNHIRGLVSSHGDWCTDTSGMAEIVERYFTNLFSSINPTADERNRIHNYVNTTIDDQINSILCAPFSAAEVRKALFDMHPNKALGPDGMSVLFFQKFWDVIGEETTAAILKILNDGAAIEDWNATIVTLVPKIQNPMTMKDFRPISLCNVCYKIVARSLTNRLSPILNKTVNEFQSAFIPGRLIYDNITLGFEALHWIRSRKKGQKGYGSLKLDMRKAYDKVEWSLRQSPRTWRVDEGKKRLHWKSWEALCQPKCKGGLGFRYLEIFNKALLAKQIWRILKNPGSLVARVLKAWYFRHQDIMKASLGNNPSYLWRSLLWSRPLLENGICWHVGDGDKKESLVRHHFSHHLVEEILAIPISSTHREDYRFWLFDPKGNYIVRDGLALSSTREPNKCISPKVWVSPPEDKLRLDVDAAYNEDSNNFAIGGVVRNHEGQPVLAFGRKIDKPQSITRAELLAIEGGLQIAHLHDLPIH
ncbi:uncharacterized protein LOC142537712 [Primulina tabacum]|uniref:uncharacterized protein LOC142537712 n=1 Tax=Primulina tabacum TaxID=48773 RepID=UPI003F5A3946